MATAKDVMKTIKDNEVLFVDLRFTDTKGKEQHVSVPVKAFEDDKFELGHAFDGSSIAGWKGIEASDMLLLPDPDTARMDPFREENTLILTCDVIEPSTGKGYDRDPRSLAKRAEAYLKSTGLGDIAYFGPEPEFFIFDAVTWSVDMSGSMVRIKSEEAPWSTGIDYEAGNLAHRPPLKGGYFPVPPTDSLQDIRSEMCLLLEQQGVEVEVHHHEVAAPGQCEIGTKFTTLTKRADWLQILKYTVWNVAASYGKTATFMPKPVVGDNGSGMHVHQSIWNGGTNLFAGNGYAGLSDFALHYIGGIIKHARALNAITNPGHQFVQASGAGLRSAGEARVLGAQPFGVDSHSVCLESEGPPYRSALSRPDRECVHGVCRDDDGRAGWRAEQDPSGRAGGQESVRPAAGRRREDSDRVLLARTGARVPGQRPRVPDARWRVQQRPDRRLHRAENG